MAVARSRRGLVALLLVLGTLATFAGSFAWWLDRQALSASGWQTTSSQLIANRDIRAAVGTFAVDELFRRTAASKTLHSLLPAPAADLLLRRARALGQRLAASILASRPAQTVWDTANRQAHRDLLRILDHGGRRGEVALNLTPLLVDLVRGLTNSPLLSRLPSAARSQLFSLSGSQPGQLPILSAEQVDKARAAVNVLRGLSLALAIAAIACLGGAIVLAGGWHARAAAHVGACLVVVGALVLVLRSILAPALADALVTSSSYRPGAKAAWSISTTELRSTAIVILVVGVVSAAIGLVSARREASAGTARPSARDRARYR